MSELWRKNEYAPQNDNSNTESDGEAVTLKIKSSLDKTNERLDMLRPKHFTESTANDVRPEDELAHLDASSTEQLNHIRDYLEYLKEQIATYTAAGGLKEASEAKLSALQQIGEQISSVYDLLRFQNESLAEDADDEVIQQRGQRIMNALQMLLETFDSFTQSVNTDEVVEEKNEIKKTGWWDKNFQEDQGVTAAGAEGELKHVWGETDGPMSFKETVAESDEEKERTGWWDASYREEQGFPQIDTEKEYTQKGEISPDPEELFPEGGTVDDVLAPERIQEYRKWEESIQKESSSSEKHDTSNKADDAVDGLDTANEPIPEEIEIKSEDDRLLQEYLTVLGLTVSQINAFLSKQVGKEKLLQKARQWQREFATSAKGNSNGPAAETAAKDAAEKKEAPTESAALRKEWLEAKHAHAEAEREYLEALETFYGGFTVRTRTTFGFKPDLPAEIKELSKRRAKTAALYSQVADRMVEAKKREKPVLEKYLERHKRLQARTLVLRTFDDQQNIQRQVAETKYPGVREFFQKHGKKIRYGSAAALGFVTGGLLGASYSVTRALGGAAITGQAVQSVGKKYDEKVTAAREKFEADYSAEAEQLISLLQNKGSLSEQELAEVIVKLDELAGYVDAVTQERIRAVMATAIGVSIAFGGGSAALDDVLFAERAAGAVGEEAFGIGADGGESRESIRAAAEAKFSASDGLDRDGIRAAAEEKLAAGAAETSQEAVVSEVAEVQKSTEHMVEKGDTMWKYLKEMGYSDAETMKVINGLSEEQLKEVGFGIGSKADADELMTGVTVDLEKLEQFAEGITDSDGVVAEGPGADASGGDALAASEAEVSESQGATEAQQEGLIMKAVSQDKLFEYARGYEGGYMKFETDFQKQFVEKIQGPAPSDGLFNRLFGGPPNSADAFKVFGPYSVGEFTELAKVDEASLAKALAAEQIDLKDYEAWRDALQDWKKQGLIMHPKDKFVDVAGAAFINSLERTKAA